MGFCVCCFLFLVRNMSFSAHLENLAQASLPCRVFRCTGYLAQAGSSCRVSRCTGYRLGQYGRTAERQSNKKTIETLKFQWVFRWIWWSIGGSNPWPQDCEPCALPAELMPRNLIYYSTGEKRFQYVYLQIIPSALCRFSFSSNLRKPLEISISLCYY